MESADMPKQQDQAGRLAQHVEDRRTQLGLRWADVADRSGLSTETLRQFRTRPHAARGLTRAAVERALQWEGGSITAVLAGGEPIPLSGVVPAVTQQAGGVFTPPPVPLPLTDEQWVHRLDRPDVPPRVRKAILAVLAARGREEQALTDLFDALAEEG